MHQGVLVTYCVSGEGERVKGASARLARWRSGRYSADFLNERRKRDLAQRSIIEDLNLMHILSAGVNMQISTVVEIVWLDRTAQLKGRLRLPGSATFSFERAREKRKAKTGEGSKATQSGSEIRLHTVKIYGIFEISGRSVSTRGNVHCYYCSSTPSPGR